MSSDPAIKLFGRTISFPETEGPVEERTNPHPEEPIVVPPEAHQDIETVEGNETKDAKLENSKDLEIEDGSQFRTNSHESSQPAQILKEKTDPNSEQLPAEADAPGQEKVLKKPDKILPCPRCNSMDTKFCYYNNYNVNQPRHFCKNCQRYWTAGGTMRNVPIGAGRRKNKHSSSHYRHLLVPSNGMQSVRVENSDSSCGYISPYGHSTPTSPFKGNKAVVMFGQEAPLCESMANVLSLTDQKTIAEMSTLNAGGSTKNESSSVSMVAPSKCTENGLSDKIPGPDKTDTPASSTNLMPANPLHCYPGPPWAYPWNPVWNGVASLPAGQCTPEMVNGQKSCSSNPNPNANPIAWNIPPMISALPFTLPTMPYPFIPAPASYWGSMVSWSNGTWGAPWPGATASLSPSSSNSGSSSNHSTNLGKHSRDADSQVEEKAEKSLWVPKTLRIDDPDEASKSSIWATLGIKPDRNEAKVKGGMFKSFEPKDKKQDNRDAAQVLHANPAALSRSFAFQEST